MAGVQVPACPRCEREGLSQPMDFVPGQITNGPSGIQLRQVYCPRCSYLHPEWWAPHRIRRHSQTRSPFRR